MFQGKCRDNTAATTQFWNNIQPQARMSVATSYIILLFEYGAFAVTFWLNDHIMQQLDLLD